MDGRVRWVLHRGEGQPASGIFGGLQEMERAFRRAEGYTYRPGGQKRRAVLCPGSGLAVDRWLVSYWAMGARHPNHLVMLSSKPCCIKKSVCRAPALQQMFLLVLMLRMRVPISGMITTDLPVYLLRWKEDVASQYVKDIK